MTYLVLKEKKVVKIEKKEKRKKKIRIIYMRSKKKGRLHLLPYMGCATALTSLSPLDFDKV